MGMQAIETVNPSRVAMSMETVNENGQDYCTRTSVEVSGDRNLQRSTASSISEIKFLSSLFESTSDVDRYVK